MKKFFSLVLALVMALSLTTVAWGADPVATVDGTGYADLQTAVNAADGKTVVMQENVNMPGNAALQIPEGANVTIDMNGKTLTSMDGGSPNWMAIKINRGATLTLTGNGKIVASCYGVYVNPGATFNLVSGSIEVSGNGTYDYAVVVWNATFNMSGGSLKGQEGVHTSDYWATTGGETGLPTTTVSITGGSIEAIGANPVTIATEGAYDITISGGTFSDDVSEYVAAGYAVVGGEIVKASNSYTGLYAGATSEGANVVAITSLNFFKANDNEVNEDGTYKADGNVAYYTVTGDQYFTGKYYVEVKTLAKADVVVYTDAAGKNVYMYLDQIEDPFYYGDGVVTKNFGTACGQYNAKNPAYDKKATYYVAFETLYVGDKVSPTEWLMVNGEVVGVDVAFDDVVAHAPVYTRDEDGEIVAIKCSKCGAVAVEAPNFLSMPKNADRVGNTLWYFPVAGAIVDTETKVESAETFDAGIAMYVGMSVMAAAGSVVVLKKRED